MRFFKLIFFISVGFILFCSCSHQIQKQLIVTRVKPGEISNSNNSVIYKLPLNGVHVQIEVEKESRFAGPYAKFAQKYLGIQKGIIFQDAEYFRISNLKMNSVSTIDDSVVFKIIENNTSPISLALSPKGHLLGANCSDISTEETPINGEFNFPPTYPELLFPNLGIKRFIGQKSESQGKTIKKDSSLIKVPFTRKQEMIKTTELTAEEAANFIFKLRKRRFKLLAGIYEEPMQHIDATGMANRLDSIEKEYIELFTGKILKQNEMFNFYVFPNKNLHESILCYFSPNEGLTKDTAHVLETENREVWSPVVLKLLRPISKNTIQLPDTCPGIIFRVPAIVNTSIYIDDRVVIENILPYSQLGEYSFIPEKYFLNQDYLIEFYKESGALKRIEKKSGK